ncbi:MAG: mechanosensitive ion channel family protein, partial [Acidobacteriota bacterium]
LALILALALALTAGLSTAPAGAQVTAQPGAGSTGQAPAGSTPPADPAAGQEAGSEPEPVPPERRTPRATMMSFLEAFYQEEGGIEQAVAALDLSEVPEAVQPVKGPELAVQLKEILDRTRLIDPEEIPDRPDADPYVFLSLPAGDVTIDRGERGEWLFTAGTVAAIPDLFRALEDEEVVEGVRPASHSLSPGLWLRSKVPRSLHRAVFLLELWQWLGLLVLAVVGIAVDRVVVFGAQMVTRRWLRRRIEEVDDEGLHKALRPLGLVAMALIWSAGLRFLWLPVGALSILEVAVRFVLATGAVWAAYRMVDILSAVLEERARRTDNRFDDLLVPLVRRSLKVFIAAFGLVFIAETLEMDISSLLAGLGLGGLAVALAAQDAVKNLFGSLMILVDRPFSVGDWVVIGSFEGIIEDVGFRSVRIRTFYNSLITLPNSNLISSAVDNYGARRYRRWSTTLSITYDTPPETIEAFCEGIRELVRRSEITRKDAFEIHLTSFGDSGLEILLYVFFETSVWSDELAARHALGVGILRLAERLGVDFAFPTRTVWLHQEAAGEAPGRTPPSGDPAEAGRRAAESVLAGGTGEAGGAGGADGTGEAGG